MDDLLAEFVAETREMIGAAGNDLVALEADPLCRARLDSIFRFFHTVKGNCGFFDLPRLERLSHAAEGALAQVRAGQRFADHAFVSLVLAIVDRISVLIDGIEAGTPCPALDDEALIEALAAPDDAKRTPTSAHPSAAASVRQRSVRLPVYLLDSAMNGMADLVLARNALARELRHAGADPSVDAGFNRLSAILDGMRETVTRMRMQPIDTLFAVLPRLVRDLCGELGKDAALSIDGGDVELDRELIETLRDPLTHIIRNAIDHGIEPPAIRARAGKPASGQLSISARQSGNTITVSVRDDGQGIDRTALRARAVSAGVVPPTDAGSLDDAEAAELVFAPGISTARTVTQVSGRGVGMDVVRANLERIGGTVRIESVPGEGTTIMLAVPLTLSIVPALTIEAGGQTYAVPQSSIDEIVRRRSGETGFDRVGEALLATVRGERLPCLPLAALTGTQAANCDPADSTLVIARMPGGVRVALAVDRVFDHQELVIKPLSPEVMAAGCFAGAALMEDGRPVLMLDVAGLARPICPTGNGERTDRAVRAPAATQPADPPVPLLLFVGLDGRQRAVALAAVQRIERVSASAFDLGGTEPRIILDDTLVPVSGITQPKLPETLNIMRLNGSAQAGVHAVAQVIDTITVPAERLAAGDRLLIAGRPTDLVTASELIAGGPVACAP